MDLWIRSQHKDMLLKINKLATGIEPETNYFTVEGGSNDFEYILARYETEERTYEVLDEIQKLLMGQDIMCFKNTGLKYHDHADLYQAIQENKWVALCNEAKIEYIAPRTIVYEMPEK